jgi:4'-phosphopantetheinyl transferase
VVDAVSVAWSRVVPIAPDRLASLLARLPPDERERAARYRFPRDRDMFVAGRALARRMLTEAAGPQVWRFTKDAHGKLAIDPPYGEPPLHFNITHSDGIVACAVAHGISVGIDLEAIDREYDFADMLDSTLAPEERARFDERGGTERAEFFFAIWTLKEAIGKACGIGLGMAFDATCLGLEPAPHLVRCAPGIEATGWRLSLHTPLATHQLALAFRPPADRAPSVDVREVPAADLFLENEK